VFKCDKRIPGDTSKKLEDVRAVLEQEVFARKLNLELGKAFQELRAQAKPVNLLKPDTPSQAIAEAEQVIKEDRLPPPKGMMIPPPDAPPAPGQ
jgi:hypothetical protein